MINNYFKSILFFQNSFSKKILFFLILIIPFAYFSGPFLTDVIVTLITILYFLSIKQKDIQRNILFFIYLIIVTIYLTANHYLLNSNELNYLKSAFYFRFLIIIPVIFFIFTNLKLRQFLLFSIFFSSFFLIFDLYFQKIFGFNILGIDAIESFNKGMHFQIQTTEISNVTRYSGIFGSELIAGSFLSKFFLVNLIFLEYELIKSTKHWIKKNKTIIILLFIIIYFVAIMITGERVAFIYSIIFLILYLFFLNFDKKKFLVFVLSVLILIPVLTLNTKFKERYIDSTVSEIFLSNKQEIVIKNIFKNKHLSHYSGAVSIFKENIIFGGGFKNYRYICNKKIYQCSTHPHNIPLEILSSLGVFGFILFYSLFYIFYHLYLASNLDNNKKKLIFIYFFVNFLFILPTGSIFNNYFSIISFYSAGVLMLTLVNFNKKKIGNL